MRRSDTAPNPLERICSSAANTNVRPKTAVVLIVIAIPASSIAIATKACPRRLLNAVDAANRAAAAVAMNKL